VVLSELGRRPEVGDHVTLGPLDIEVLDVEGHRVRQVRATVREEAAAERS
jgi:CBS domain containing-hemolysin-like protein